MAPGVVFHHLLLLLLALLPLCMAMDSIGQYCDGSGGYRGGQTASSINSVLAELVAKASVGGFATSSAGRGSSVIYGLAQCRGDVGAGDCAACLADAAKQLPVACPGQTDARIWYDYCFMRYDNIDFIGQADTAVATILVNVQDAADPKSFAKAVGRLMGKVTAQAAAAGSGGLGRDKAQFSPFVAIYGLAQCTRDLQALACAQCLSSAVARLGDYCGARQGCQIDYSSCMARYEIYPFYFPLGGSGRGSAAFTDQSQYSKFTLKP